MNERIVLAVSPVSLGEIYGGLAKVGAVSPPLNLLLLAAIVREHGFTPSIIDSACLGLGYEAVVERIRTAAPLAVGLTAMTPHIMQTAKLAALIRERIPGLPIMLGGVHISSAPEETMARFPQIDVGVLGSADNTLPELLRAMRDGQDLANVPGLILRRDGGLLRTPERRDSVDLASLPRYAWDLLEGFPERYRTPLFAAHRSPATAILTSRGCPGKCTYCFSGCHKTIATYPAGYIFDMLVHLKQRYGIREFQIFDDNFVMYRKNLRELLGRMIEEKLDLTWSCNARVDMVNAETLALMKRAGCWQISYGIESGNQAIIDSLGKKITRERIREALEMTREAGIRSVGYFMIGHFRETVQTIRETIAFACGLPLDDFRMSFFTPLPGTAANPVAHQFGEFDDDWGKMTLFSPVFIPHGLTRDELVAWQKRAMRRFFLRPRIIASYLKLVRNPAVFAKGCLEFARYVFSRD